MRARMGAGGVLSSIRRDLKSCADEKTRSGYERFFKENVKYYGVKSATVSKIGKRHFDSLQGKGKGRVFELCEELFNSGYCEEAFIAADWAYRVRKDYAAGDFGVFEHWIGSYVDNWAKCDTLCNHAVGSFIEKYPEYLRNLKSWAKSDNRWLRRAAAVSLVLPARNGKFLSDVFEIADILLEDEDDIVQKGYGWMLKETSKPHRKEVFDYVMRNRAAMPRTALRYAIEKMPDTLRKKAMGG